MRERSTSNLQFCSAFMIHIFLFLSYKTVHVNVLQSQAHSTELFIILELYLIASEASFLVCSMRGFSIYLYIYIFQAVRRAVNEMFETPDTVFNNLELLVNPSSTAKKCSATEDCCRNPGGDRHPSSTVKYCSATGLLPNRQRGERPGVNGLPFSHRRKETPVFNKLQLLVNRRLRQNRRKRNKPVFNS